MFTFPDVVYLYRLVARRRHEQLAVVVVVYRKHVWWLAVIFDVFTPEKLQERIDGQPSR